MTSTPQARFMNTDREGPGTIYIKSLDNETLIVKAQFNPKELQVDKTVPWQKVNQSNNENKQGIHLEFTGAEGRTTSIELLFDDTEGGSNVSSAIKMLEEMTSVFAPGDPDETKRRPHHCVVTWGSTVKFRCVIETLSTKYTMFSKEGAPLRATCTVKLKEADDVKGKKADKPNTSTSPNSGGGAPSGGGPAGPTG